MTVSKSPDRLTFQKECYIKRCEETGREPDPDYLEMFESDRKRYDARFESKQAKQYSLEYDLLTSPEMLTKVRANKVYAQNLYAAMCNRDFVKNEVWPLLSAKKWSCSWRYAGGIIADMREEGDYIDWYCSGIKGKPSINDEGKENDDGIDGYVGEGHVTNEIRSDLLQLGWTVVDDDQDDSA